MRIHACESFQKCIYCFLNINLYNALLGAEAFEASQDNHFVPRSHLVLTNHASTKM